MHLLIGSQFPRTKLRTVQSGLRARISVARSEVVVHPCYIDKASSTQPDPDSASYPRAQHDILGLVGFLATIYHDDEQRAADRKQVGPI